MVVNEADPDSRMIVKQHGGPYLTFGLSPEADIRLKEFLTMAPVALDPCRGGEKAHVNLPMGGPFNVLNALAASALAVPRA